MAELLGGDPGVMLTLTRKPDPTITKDIAAQQLSHAWRKLRLRAMRHYNLKALPFMAVFEQTKAGQPHLHILLRVKWLDQQWLSAQMDDLLQSPIVHIKRLDSRGRAAAYCAKYCGKSPNQFGKCKRYWKSQDYEKRPKKDKLKHIWWTDSERLHHSIWQLYEVFRHELHITWLSPFRFLAQKQQEAASRGPP